MERRDLLRGGAIAAAMVIAGCSDEGDDDPADGNGDTNDTDEGDGGDDTDGADGNGDTADGENATDEETDDAEGNETDGEDGGDDQDGEDNESADNESADNESADNETDGNETEGDGEGDVEDVSFAETVEAEDSYAFETEGGEGAEAVASTGRIDGENMYVAIEESGGTVEMYIVEGETYLVEGEECMVLPGTGEEFDQEDVEDPEAEAEAQPDVEASGRDTIDGEEVHVFELSGEEAAQYDEDVTYYVSVETGYIRRIETGSSVTDFHSWGDVEPVEAPEMECVDMGDFNESDIPL